MHIFTKDSLLRLDNPRHRCQWMGGYPNFLHLFSGVGFVGVGGGATHATVHGFPVDSLHRRRR